MGPNLFEGMKAPPHRPPRPTWRRGPPPAHSGARPWQAGRLVAAPASPPSATLKTVISALSTWCFLFILHVLTVLTFHLLYLLSAFNQVKQSTKELLVMNISKPEKYNEKTGYSPLRK